MKLSFILLLLLPLLMQGQPNCNFYLYKGDTLQYHACKLVEDIDKKYYQFSKQYQQTMDEALLICPYFAYAYREKAAAYVKSGDFITWKKLIDKAVEYAPLEYLGVRASLRYKFFADYQGALVDIQQLDSLVDSDIGFSSNGTYHLYIVKALCHKQLGQKKVAIALIESQLKKESHLISAYDYLHLGVLYLETNQYVKAIEALQKQRNINNLAECNYYLGLVYKQQEEREKYLDFLQEAKELYLNGYRMRDPYNEEIDRVYLESIENELRTATSLGFKPLPAR